VVSRFSSRKASSGSANENSPLCDQHSVPCDPGYSLEHCGSHQSRPASGYDDSGLGRRDPQFFDGSGYQRDRETAPKESCKGSVNACKDFYTKSR